MRGVGGHTMERVVNPGSDLIDDLLTPLSWYPGDYIIDYNKLVTSFIYYIKLVTNSASWLHTVRCFFVWRDNTVV